MSLKEWLAQYNCVDLQEARIVIGRTSYEAVFYKQEPEVEAVMLLGALPASYRRSRRTAYRFPGDERDWYVVSWTSREVATNPEFARYHYEGRESFQMRPWKVGEDGVQIDEYESYSRVKALVFQAA